MSGDKDVVIMDIELSRSQKTFFEMARKVSHLASFTGSKAKIGCLIVYGHRVISSGYNSDKTNQGLSSISPLKLTHHRIFQQQLPPSCNVYGYWALIYKQRRHHQLSCHRIEYQQCLHFL